MNLGDLALFEAAVRLGTLGAAARELALTQPGASLRLRRLERDLGTSLLHRHPHGVSLTPSGERLLPYSLEIMRLNAEARRVVQQDLAQPSGPGAPPPSCSHPVAPCKSMSPGRR